jgi:hypothetical protein
MDHVPSPLRLLLALGVGAGLLAGCTQVPRPEVAPAAPPASVLAPDPVDGEIVLYRSPTCTCCHGHAEHLEEAGFEVRSEIVEDIRAVKEELGVPAALESCHTSVIGGYFVEGHMPADVITRLLTDRPDIDGIALPGMPAGSPGMSGDQDAPFVIQAVSGEHVEVYMSR